MEEYTKEKEMQKDVRVEHDHSFLPEADIFIYGTDHVLITSFEEKMGVMIESRLIHDTIRAIFERQWEVLK
jgi:hypothetical protein